jgi:hypothetical protein
MYNQSLKPFVDGVINSPVNTQFEVNSLVEVKKLKTYKSKKCVECGDHVPAYMNFLCETCWGKALNEKLLEDDRKRLEAAKKVDIENSDNRLFR